MIDEGEQKNHCLIMSIYGEAKFINKIANTNAHCEIDGSRVHVSGQPNRLEVLGVYFLVLSQCQV